MSRDRTRRRLCQLRVASEEALPTALVSPNLLSPEDGPLGNLNIICTVPVCHIHEGLRLLTGRIKLGIVLSCTIQDKTPNYHSENSDSMKDGRSEVSIGCSMASQD